ncbi:nitroreductase/quinone reductase family protein [Gordonia sp. CPCC 206044]|uniref:nitroreductase/quinone reductase family protein n=1 Tax=Gordonia sp. CPCC 206044 TaxID=3140793 RepID=UPI003AF3CC20
MASDGTAKVGAKPDWLVATGAWLLENGHRLLLTVTGGRFPTSMLGMQVVELETIGRKSGLPRKTLLSSPINDAGRVVVIASKGGYQDDPQWYKNLVANPEVKIHLDGEVLDMRARTATGEERRALWQQAVATYRGYAGYQKNTNREIPVVVCERTN